MFAKDNDDEVAATRRVSSPVGLTWCFPRVNNVARAATHDPIHVAVKGNNYPIRKFVNHQCTTSSWPRDRRATHKKVTHELKGIKYEDSKRQRARWSWEKEMERTHDLSSFIITDHVRKIEIGCRMYRVGSLKTENRGTEEQKQERRVTRTWPIFSWEKGQMWFRFWLIFKGFHLKANTLAPGHAGGEGGGEGGVGWRGWRSRDDGMADSGQKLWKGRAMRERIASHYF